MLSEYIEFLINFGMNFFHEVQAYGIKPVIYLLIIIWGCEDLIFCVESERRTIKRFVRYTIYSGIVAVCWTFMFFYDAYCIQFTMLQYRYVPLLIISELVVMYIMCRLVKKK